MMLFQRNPDLASIRSFYVTTSSAGHDQPIAYGPGSIINGTLMITVDKPLSAHNIHIVFKCEELDSSKKQSTTIFSVDSVIWGKAKEDSAEPQELSSGSHMFLFAIRLPQVNYPPSMHDSHFGHRIEYTLHGVFDLVSTSHPTEKIPILYLPLVTCNPTTYETSKKTQMFQKEDKKIEVSAELIKPAYCPGDLCTVKMTTSNNSNTKITGVQVSLVALATTLAPTVSSDYVHKQHTLLSEYFYVSIPKNARDHHDIFRFDIPSTIVPTFTNKLGKYMDIAYQVNIDIPNLIPNNTGGIFGGGSGSMGNASTISLPITIATVPPSYPIQVTVHESTDELPTFIPNIESPLPSPVHYPADRAYSVSPSNSFQMRDIDFDLEVEDFALNSHTQDASGLLMVPDNTTRRRSSSEFSDASTLGANSMNRLETVS